jgi:hypothetical protein
VSAAVLTPAHVVIPGREEHYRRYVALPVLLVVERDGAIVAWVGLKTVMN